jgi:hypothetical protein
LEVQETSTGDISCFGVTESYSAGSRDAWLIKTDSNGDEDWNKSWGRAQCDGSLGGLQTSGGGYIVCGWGRWSPSWDTDFWLIKTYSSGNEEWNKRFGLSGSNNDDVAYDIQEITGGYIAAGMTESYGDGENDAWMIKMDSTGSEDWNITFGESGNDKFSSIQQTPDGGYILTGTFYSPDLSSQEVLLFKTDSNGEEEWSKTFGGAPGSDVGHEVQVTDDNGYIIIGRTSYYGDGDYDIWLIKTDSIGNEEWNKTWSGADSGYADAFGLGGGMSVKQTSDDGFILVGMTDETSTGSNDAVLIKTDSDGNEEWNKTFGGAGHDEGYSVYITSDEDYLIGGGTVSFGTSTWDGWLIKTDSDGNEDWNVTFGSAAPGNNPPNNPFQPEGPDEGFVDIEYSFETHTDDPDGDDVYYKFDWGDGTDSGWLGPFSSGDTVNESHSWDSEGNYELRAKAKDEEGDESGWSYSSYIDIIKPNEPPYKPDISGPNEIKTGEEHDYSFKSKDPEAQDICYYIEWGDGDTFTTEYVESNTEVTLNHSWDSKGDFEIRCKSIDIHDAESEWATKSITVPKNKPYNHNFPILNWMFDRFPNAFPILRYILG